MDAKNKKQQSVAAILAQTQKESNVSAYGTTVDLICSDLSLLSDKSRLMALLQQKGIDTKAKANAITTGIGQVRTIVQKLLDNGYLS